MEGLSWQNRIQFGVMILMAAVMPVSWRLGVWTAVLLALVSLVKLVADTVKGGRPFVNQALNGWQRLAFCTMPAYVVCYAASLLYSSNIASGLEILGRKAVMLVFPLCFLLTDTTYMAKKHIRILFYALLMAVCGVFLYWCGVAVGKLFNGASMASVTGITFDVRHHSYFSLYAVVACVFVYFELESHWHSLPKWHKGLLFASVVFIILYIVMINSRAGMLSLYAMTVACAVHLGFRSRRWWAAFALFVAVGGFTVVSEVIIPGHNNRIIETLKKDSDARIDINKSSFELAKGTSVFGKGVGDYGDELQDQYVEDEKKLGGLNAHNQYIESFLAIGIPGLLCLLAWLILPLVCAVRNRKTLWPVMFFVGIVMFNLLFESMLERQMGILFIGFFMAVIVLITSIDENKFCDMEEK